MIILSTLQLPTTGLMQWKAYTALATQQYTYPQLLVRVTLLDIVGFTANVEADVKLAQDL